MIRRNRTFVAYIRFCLELDEYDCTWCYPASAGADFEEALAISDTGHCPITSFHTLFSILSTWDLTANLILDISIYSPSDSKHWFKYLTFMPDTALDTLDGQRNIQHMVLKNKPTMTLNMDGFLVLHTTLHLGGCFSKLFIQSWKKGRLIVISQSYNGGIGFRRFLR
jgi:hypothetical protein